MGRKNRNAKRKFDTRLSLSELARKAGLTPRQKIKMLRYVKEHEGG